MVLVDNFKVNIGHAVHLFGPVVNGLFLLFQTFLSSSLTSGDFGTFEKKVKDLGLR